MHSDSTLKHLEVITTKLGKLVRDFEKKVCSKFSAVELPREAEARKRRQGARQSGVPSGAHAKKLNLFMYKWHALGDYVSQIRLFGGSDGFSTQMVWVLMLFHVSVILIICVAGRACTPIGQAPLWINQQTKCTKANCKTISPDGEGAPGYGTSSDAGEATASTFVRPPSSKRRGRWSWFAILYIIISKHSCSALSDAP